MERKDNLYVIIHGHFYQPPREEPYTLRIERQESAYPFHDWNERINRECYAPNSASRVLNEKSQIIAIINNYEYISFNFGPTLMKWLKENDFDTYKRIIEADKKSQKENNGHGNAIAQAYNHIILPLATDKEIRLQVELGLYEFENDFKRQSEGLWLPETAVNLNVIDILIDYKIKFIILSPSQAKSIKPINSNEIIDVSNGSIDTSIPYLIERKHGNIIVFFYNDKIASKLSFGHLLRNATHFKNEILSHRKLEEGVSMINVATDGEVYGHHEPFGDMCLSRLIYENNIEKNFTFTNYGNILELIEPKNIVFLKEGENNLGTSWSCFHGVERWHNDCGCTTNSRHNWNQKWRKPLRNAFEFLRDNLYNYAYNYLTEYFKDIHKAQIEFFNFIHINDFKTKKECFENFLKNNNILNLNENEKNKINKIFHSLYYSKLMFTSCGWFFSEISGIETLQNLKYATMIFEMMKDYFSNDIESKFKNILAEAKSNIPEYVNGLYVYENLVNKNLYRDKNIVAENSLYVFFNSLNYVDKNITIKEIKKLLKNNLEIGRIILNLSNIITLEQSDYYTCILKNNNILKIFIKKINDPNFISFIDNSINNSNEENIEKILLDWFSTVLSINDIRYDAKEKVLNSLYGEELKRLHKKIFNEELDINYYVNILEDYDKFNVRIPDRDKSAIEELFNRRILSELEELEDFDITTHNFDELIKIIKIAKKSKLHIDYTDIIPIYRNYVLKRLKKAFTDFDMEELKNINYLIKFANMCGIDFEKFEIQNILMEILNKLKNNEIYISGDKYNIIIELSELFNIDISNYKYKYHNFNN